MEAKKFDAGLFILLLVALCGPPIGIIAAIILGVSIDEDPSGFVLMGFFGILIFVIMSMVFSITACMAWSSTRKWQKEKARQSEPSTESETLIKSAEDSESELDPEDSGDEAELKLREEKRRDLTLTTRQYFRKELNKCWKGDGTVQSVQKAKEREERKKLAKAVARELVKLEKKRERKIVGEKNKEM